MKYLLAIAAVLFAMGAAMFAAAFVFVWLWENFGPAGYFLVAGTPIVLCSWLAKRLGY